MIDGVSDRYTLSCQLPMALAGPRSLTCQLTVSGAPVVTLAGTDTLLTERSALATKASMSNAVALTAALKVEPRPRIVENDPLSLA